MDAAFFVVNKVHNCLFLSEIIIVDSISRRKKAMSLVVHNESRCKRTMDVLYTLLNEQVQCGVEKLAQKLLKLKKKFFWFCLLSFLLPWSIWQ